jgi:hypothetical protein
MCKNIWARRKRFFLKAGSLGHMRVAGRRPLVAGRRWRPIAGWWPLFAHQQVSSSSRGPRTGRRPTVTYLPWPVVWQTADWLPFFAIFGIMLIIIIIILLLLFCITIVIFLCYENGLGIFGRMGVQHSHFLKLAPILGREKSSIPHGAWKFHFFPFFG